MNVDDCPLCGHEMDIHPYTDENGKRWDLAYCERCECDFASVGMDEWIGLDEPFGTRPITVITSEVEN